MGASSSLRTRRTGVGEGHNVNERNINAHHASDKVALNGITVVAYGGDASGEGPAVVWGARRCESC
jgi:hypothetical protein